MSYQLRRLTETGSFQDVLGYGDFISLDTARISAQSYANRTGLRIIAVDDNDKTVFDSKFTPPGSAGQTN